MLMMIVKLQLLMNVKYLFINFLNGHAATECCVHLRVVAFILGMSLLVLLASTECERYKA